MIRNNIPARIAALEEAAPNAVQAWSRVIVPEGLTPDQRQAWIAAEHDRLPPGTNLIAWVPVAPAPSGE